MPGERSQSGREWIKIQRIAKNSAGIRGMSSPSRCWLVDKTLTCDIRREYDVTNVAKNQADTRTMTMPKQVTELLTRREREIMNAIFALGNRTSAEEIRARMTNPPGDSSVRVMLTRLESKGFVKHQRDGIRYLYSATISPAVAKRTALQQFVQTFFGGSLRQMMTALVNEASWTDDDLDALRAEIDRVRKERPQS